MTGNSSTVDLYTVFVELVVSALLGGVSKPRAVLTALSSYLLSTIMTGKHDPLAIHALSLCH